MAENGNHTPGGNEGGERVFTQSEMDAIIGERLSRERSKYADYDSLKEKAGKYDEFEQRNKTELQKANEKADALQREIDQLKTADAVRQAREKVSKELNIPAELLTGEDEESCKKQAEAILKFAKPKSYPGTDENKRKRDNQETDANMRTFARQLFGGGE